jgi:hypothetical protein
MRHIDRWLDRITAGLCVIVITATVLFLAYPAQAQLGGGVISTLTKFKPFGGKIVVPLEGAFVVCLIPPFIAPLFVVANTVPADPNKLLALYPTPATIYKLYGNLVTPGVETLGFYFGIPAPCLAITPVGTLPAYPVIMVGTGKAPNIK